MRSDVVLVDPFCFSVCLRVVCGREGKFVSEDSSEFFLEVCCKLGSSVGYDFVEKSKARVEFSENDGGYSFRGDCFLGGA